MNAARRWELPKKQTERLNLCLSAGSADQPSDLQAKFFLCLYCAWRQSNRVNLPFLHGESCTLLDTVKVRRMFSDRQFRRATEKRPFEKQLRRFLYRFRKCRRFHHLKTRPF